MKLVLKFSWFRFTEEELYTW